MGCEGTFITTILLRYSYQVPNLDNYAMKLYIKTGLRHPCTTNGTGLERSLSFLYALKSRVMVTLTKEKYEHRTILLIDIFYWNFLSLLLLLRLLRNFFLLLHLI
jgi:hypothetical protein